MKNQQSGHGTQSRGGSKRRKGCGIRKYKVQMTLLNLEKLVSVKALGEIIQRMRKNINDAKKKKTVFVEVIFH